MACASATNCRSLPPISSVLVIKKRLGRSVTLCSQAPGRSDGRFASHWLVKRAFVVYLISPADSVPLVRFRGISLFGSQRRDNSRLLDTPHRKSKYGRRSCRSKRGAWPVEPSRRGNRYRLAIRGAWARIPAHNARRRSLVSADLP